VSSIVKMVDLLGSEFVHGGTAPYSCMPPSISADALSQALAMASQ